MRTYHVKFYSLEDPKLAVISQPCTYDEAGTLRDSLEPWQQPQILYPGHFLRCDDKTYLIAEDGRAIDLFTGEYAPVETLADMTGHQLTRVFASEIVW